MARTVVSLHVETDDLRLQEKRHALCSQVIEILQPELKGSDLTTICLIDDIDYDYLKMRIGTANRGLFAVLRPRTALTPLLPTHLHNQVVSFDRKNLALVYKFDSMIYIHGSTAESDIGLVLTLAHELRHFCQYADQRAIWAINQLFNTVGEPEFKVTWDLPIEIDARHFSKQVAEKIFGESAVRDFILQKARGADTELDRNDWNFLLSLRAIPQYSVVHHTKELAEKLQNQLRAISQSKDWQEHPDVPRLNFETFELNS